MSTVNNQFPTPNDVFYSVATTHEALAPYSLPGVMKLATGRVIRLDASSWKDCFDEINEACAYGWKVLNSNRQPTHYTGEEARQNNVMMSYSVRDACHCAGKYRPIQKKSKIVGCECTLRVRSYFARPDCYKLVIESDYSDHVLQGTPLFSYVNQQLHWILA